MVEQLKKQQGLACRRLDSPDHLRTIQPRNHHSALEKNTLPFEIRTHIQDLPTSNHRFLALEHLAASK
jgi:hypothetical protein